MQQTRLPGVCWGRAECEATGARTLVIAPWLWYNSAEAPWAARLPPTGDRPGPHLIPREPSR